MSRARRPQACAQGPHSIRVAVALACAGLLSLCGDARGAESPTIHRVIIEGTAYQPAALTIRRGDTVEWINKDPFPHTATSTTGAFDSHEIAADKSWTFTAAKSGTFPYVCAFHPTMKGVIRVSAEKR